MRYVKFVLILILAIFLIFNSKGEIVSSTVEINFMGNFDKNAKDVINITQEIPIETENQKILKIYSSCKYKLADGKIILYPKNDYSLKILVSKNISEINSVNAGHSYEFLKNYGLAKWNEEIKKKAEEITKNSENDLIKILKIAKYVHENIKYNASVMDLSAIETYKRLQGKCSEYTNLFIAMCRSINISARSVNGLICKEKCEPHAWAEVLIGDKWIEVDPTFMEIPADALHIAFSKSYEAGKINTEITSKTQVEHKGEISGKIVKNLSENFIDFDIFHNKNDKIYEVNISLKNLKNFYVAGFCKISTSLKKDEKEFYLNPESKKIINFKIPIPELNKDYIYSYSLHAKCGSIKKISEFNISYEEKEDLNKSKISLDEKSGKNLDENEFGLINILLVIAGAILLIIGLFLLKKI